MSYCEVSPRLTPSTPPAAPRDSAGTVVLGIFRRSRVPSRRPRECPPAPLSITAVKVDLHRSMAVALMAPVELRLVVAVMRAIGRWYLSRRLIALQPSSSAACLFSNSIAILHGDMHMVACHDEHVAIKIRCTSEQTVGVTEVHRPSSIVNAITYRGVTGGCQSMHAPPTHTALPALCTHVSNVPRYTV